MMKLVWCIGVWIIQFIPVLLSLEEWISKGWALRRALMWCSKGLRYMVSAFSTMMQDTTGILPQKEILRSTPDLSQRYSPHLVSNYAIGRW